MQRTQSSQEPGQDSDGPPQSKTHQNSAEDFGNSKHGTNGCDSPAASGKEDDDKGQNGQKATNAAAAANLLGLPPLALRLHDLPRRWVVGIAVCLGFVDRH